MKIGRHSKLGRAALRLEVEEGGEEGEKHPKIDSYSIRLDGWMDEKINT